MNEKQKLIVIFCVAVLAIPIFGVGTVKASSAPVEWTRNSTFVKSGYQWDPILYDWRWDALSPEIQIWTGKTSEVFPPYWNDVNYALWLEDGNVSLAASDPNNLDNWGRSARVTYGPFVDPYSDVLPPLLPVNGVSELTLRGVVSDYGSDSNGGDISWTGIKFDAWFMDPLDNNRKMVIEMYFHGTRFLGDVVLPGNEKRRTYTDGTRDYIIKLQAFPEYCTMTGDIPGSDFGQRGNFSYSYTEFTIDLKAIWQRAADYSPWGRSSADLLYAVALDVESGRLFSIPAVGAWAEVNKIMVTYTPLPSTLHLVVDDQNMYGSHDIAIATIGELTKIGIYTMMEYRDAATIANTVWGDYWNYTWDDAPGFGWDMVWYEFNSASETLEQNLESHYWANMTPPNGYNIMCWNNKKADYMLLEAFNPKYPEAERRKRYLLLWQEEFMHDPPCVFIYYPSEPICARGIAFNLHHPILSNRYVRQAIAHAIPQKKIFDEILPSGIEAWPGKAPIHPSTNYTDPNGVTVCLFNTELPPYEYNIAKAQMYMDMWRYSQVGTDYTKGPVGDADLSGFVEVVDFPIWAENIGTTSADWVFSPGNGIDPDYDNNDFVEMFDFYRWRENIGMCYPERSRTWQWSRSPVTPITPTEYPAIYVEPASIEDTAYEPGTNFTVSIWTNYTGSDIWGWQFTLYYNPLVLHGGVNMTDTWAGTGIKRKFYTSIRPLVTGSEEVYVNETLMIRDVNYTISYDIGEIMFAIAPGVGAEVKATYLYGVVNGDLITTEKDSSAKFSAGAFNNTVGKLSLTAGYFYFEDKPAPLTSGPGILAKVTFTVVGYGDSGILLGDKTKLIGVTEGGWGTEYNIIDASTMADHVQNSYFRNVEPPPTHDIAITNMTTNPTMVKVGEPVNVTVVAENQGTVAEIFDVEVYYNYDPYFPGANVIGTKTVHSLAAGANTSLTFAWDTTEVPAGNHTITAVASTVFGETDTADNTKVDGTVTIKAWDLLDEPWNQLTSWTKEGKGLSEIRTLDGKSCLYNKPDTGTYITQKKDIGTLPETGYTVETSLYVASWGTGGTNAFVAFKFYDGIHLVTVEIHSDRVVGPKNQFSLVTQTQRWYTWRFVIDSDADTIYVYRDKQYVGTLTGLTDYTRNDGLVYCSWTKNPAKASDAQSYTDYIKIATGLYTST